MFTEIFSIILLKKRKKYLKLKHHDKDARLPHPSSLLMRGKKKRELKQQLKEERKLMMRGGNEKNSMNIFGMMPTNGNNSNFPSIGGIGTGTG